MKNLLLVLSLSLFLFSCESEGELTSREIGTIPLSPGSILKYSGAFYPTAGISVSGSANIYKDGNVFKLSLEGFGVSSGPDLKVYLSTSANPDTFINLGALGNGGTQTYLAPDNVDYAVYNHVLIHCQQYNHLFAIAPLMPSN